MSFRIPPGVGATVGQDEAGAAPTKPVGAGPVSGAMSPKPLLANEWDDWNAGTGIRFHDDGPIGTAIQFMRGDARMDIDGEPLGNVLGRIATRVVTGESTAQEGVDEVKAIRDRLPDNSAARWHVDMAIELMDGPATPVPSVPPGTPEPLGQLVRDLHAVPLVRREPDKELEPLLALIEKFAAGEVRRAGLIFGVRELQARRHESFGDSGKFEIDRAVRVATGALKELPGSALMPRGSSGAVEG